MAQYRYKGFNISYDIKALDKSTNLYKADGSVCHMENEKISPMAKKFHTEGNPPIFN